MHNLKSRVGFTLIEILVAMVIFGMLVGGVLAAAAVARRSARDTIRKGDLQALHAAIQDRATSTGSYIPASGSCQYTIPGSLKKIDDTTVEVGQGNLLKFSSSGLRTLCSSDSPSPPSLVDEDICNYTGFNLQRATNVAWDIGYIRYNSQKDFLLVTRLENNSCFVIRVNR